MYAFNAKVYTSSKIQFVLNVQITVKNVQILIPAQDASLDLASLRWENVLSVFLAVVSAQDLILEYARFVT